MSRNENNAAGLKLVRVMDLIGRDIAGLSADIRTRNVDGSLTYEHTAKEGPRMVSMKRVHTPRADGHKWLRWEWDGRGLPMSHSCGFSGIWLDNAGSEYILMQEVNP